jgi:bifunctional UDP-N-acetylglucosamine pyrophosphorylase/glucosamine-1-phosphate N-acetyltransferase
MQIVILAAGRGMRMGELTQTVPKPMLKIKGKPILAYKLEALPAEVDEVIFVIGYLGEQIREYFGTFYAGKKISYVVQEKQDGSGGALARVKDSLENDFLVMNGDDLYLQTDIRNCMRNDLAVLGLEVSNPNKFGIIALNGKGELLEIIEKPEIASPALANIGLYKLNRNFFDYPLVAIGNGEYGLPQTLALLARDFPVKVQIASAWFPIGTPEDLAQACEIVDKFV